MKVKIKLFGTWGAWSNAVRWGNLIHPDGTVVEVLLRTTDEPRLPAEGRRLLSALNHPAILRLLHATSVNTKTALVYERFDGVAMARVLPELKKRNRQMPVRAALEICAQVCHALLAAQGTSASGYSIVHPGPSPAELLLNEQGSVRLAGFRVLSDSDEINTAPPGYVPPEGCGADGAWSYGIGALLVELLSGSRPAAGSADPSRHEAMIRRALIRVLARSGEPAPESVINMVRQCMARQPQARPALEEVSSRIHELINTLPSARLRPWAAGCIPTIFAMLQPDRPPSQRPEPSPEPPPALSSSASPLPALHSLYAEDTEQIDPTEEEPRPTVAIQEPAAPAASPLQAQLLSPPVAQAAAPHPSDPVLASRAVDVARDAAVPHEPVVGFAAGDFSHTEVSGPRFTPPEPALSRPAAAEPAGVDVEDSEELYRPRKNTAVLWLGGCLAAAALCFAGVSTWRSSPPDTAAAGEVAVDVERTASTAAAPAPAAEEDGAVAEEPAVAPGSEDGAPEEGASAAALVVTPPATAPAEPARPEPEVARIAPEPEVTRIAPEPEVARIAPEDDQPTSPGGLAGAVDDLSTAGVAVASGEAVVVSDAVPAAAAVASAELPAEAVPAPSVFRVEFLAADPALTELQIRCHKGSGSGTGRVVILDAGRGPCKVTGIIGSDRLVTSVSLTGEKVWTCFAAGARSCQ